MKIPISDAAKRVGVHPSNFLLSISAMVGDLSDCWPEIEEGFVETIKALRPQRSEAINPSTETENLASEAITQKKKVTTKRAPVSAAAVKILFKLSRNKNWGHHKVKLETIKNVYCKGIDDLETTIDELLEKDFLIQHKGKRGPYSLNTDKKNEIETIIQEHR